MSEFWKYALQLQCFSFVLSDRRCGRRIGPMFFLPRLIRLQWDYVIRQVVK